MAVLKCKMCGGNLEFTEGQSYGTCESCGSTMTLPKANEERILNLFNRANHYRMQNEFDKALATYESILEEDSNNAEAYWGCVLSKYGIEYVEDAKTHQRIPTCHRVQNESILSDLDYQKALNNAPDGYSKKLYEEEAEKISEIQKGILNIARNEEPYDIFICYKETDSAGQRTIDSTLAQDIYYQLTNEGYKVFFSRITLEDKLGQEYEPYIFAALNSAKIMLVIGTKAEHFNAVWVKNEWARFLEITKKDKNKLLIPCYREMDAYELPNELSLFQSQDMGKIGFIQDLLRGIGKVFSESKENDNTTVVQVNADLEAHESAQLKRAFMLLEDGDWAKANELLENVLNINPENARAYLGKLMIEVKAKKEEDLGEVTVDYSISSNYVKVLKFGNDELKNTLERCHSSVLQRINNATKNENFLMFIEEIPANDMKNGIIIVGTSNKSIRNCVRLMINGVEAMAIGMENWDKHRIIDSCNTGEKIALAVHTLKTPLDVKIGDEVHIHPRENEGCYVATCVYGSYDCPEVWTLRRFRDYKLDTTWHGRLFIKTYYAISPTIVKWFGETEWFKKLWKGKLDKMVAKLQEQGYENTRYNDKY